MQKRKHKQECNAHKCTQADSCIIMPNRTHMSNGFLCFSLVHTPAPSGWVICAAVPTTSPDKKMLAHAAAARGTESACASQEPTLHAPRLLGCRSLLQCYCYSSRLPLRSVSQFFQLSQLGSRLQSCACVVLQHSVNCNQLPCGFCSTQLMRDVEDAP